MVNYISASGYTRTNTDISGLTTSNPIENEINIFYSSGGENFIKKYNCTKLNIEEDYKTPREEYEKILSEQGFIGRSINEIKNKIPFFTSIGLFGSNIIEELLDKYENEDYPEYKVRDVIYKYGKNQKILTELILDFITIFLFLSGFLLCSPLDTDTGIKIAISSSLCAVFRLGGGIFEICSKKLNRVET